MSDMFPNLLKKEKAYKLLCCNNDWNGTSNLTSLPGSPCFHSLCAVQSASGVMVEGCGHLVSMSHRKIIMLGNAGGVCQEWAPTSGCVNGGPQYAQVWSTETVNVRWARQSTLSPCWWGQRPLPHNSGSVVWGVCEWGAFHNLEAAFNN